MRIYDTFTGDKRKFEPLQAKKVGMYVCGPTVYDFAHLGHGRSAVSFDVIRRYLIYKGYDVNFVSNYTDIDDKMINRAELMKISVRDLAERIIPEYASDYAALGIMVPDVLPKATEHVPQMIELIAMLEKKGAVYILDDGVYFDITKFPGYGKLSKQDLEALRAGARVEAKETKRNPQDFVLWKFSKPGEPEWDSPWGKGRPGWHIECSAMSRQYLGDSFDIHGGGADLMFPHHECEIAQSECALEKPFARFWLHNGFIQINNEKMSKSFGNFFLLRDVFAKYPPQAVRYLFLQTHYRSPIEFTDELLAQAKNSLARLHDFMTRLTSYESPLKNEPQKDFEDFLMDTRKRFEDAMNDDFETPQALAAVFDLVKEVNRRIDAGTLTRGSKERVMTLLTRLDTVLGVLVSSVNEEIDHEIMTLIEKREQARKEKDWKTSDEIRDELLRKGIQLEDTPGGTIWKKV
jgi:cysteinyl-tRNA synthetase